MRRRMDFGASTDHQGGAWPYWWWYTQKMTDMYHVPGAYVPIFGYERSAQYPNGHRNMFFAKRSESRVTPFFMKEGADGFGLPPGPDGRRTRRRHPATWSRTTRKMLYEEIRARNGIDIPHTSATRMGTDWRDNDPAAGAGGGDLPGRAHQFRSSSGAPLVAQIRKSDARSQ